MGWATILRPVAISSETDGLQSLSRKRAMSIKSQLLNALSEK